MNSERRLTRPTSGRMIGGVAAGLGAYFGIDVAIARIVWGLLFFAGVGVPAYLLCWIAIPREPEEIVIDDIHVRVEKRSSTFLTLVKIALLLALGGIIAANVGSDIAIVAFLVGLAFGLYYLWRNRATEEEESLAPHPTRLYRSETNRRILGVFGGLGDVIGVDPTLLRILGGIVLIAGFPVIVPLYLLYAIVVPSRRVITL